MKYRNYRVMPLENVLKKGFFLEKKVRYTIEK
jgi:hypothetical protein